MMVSWEDDRSCKRVCSVGGVRVSQRPSELDILVNPWFEPNNFDLPQIRLDDLTSSTDTER
jgi:hypothetical protein